MSIKDRQQRGLWIFLKIMKNVKKTSGGKKQTSEANLRFLKLLNPQVARTDRNHSLYTKVMAVLQANTKLDPAILFIFFISFFYLAAP